VKKNSNIQVRVPEKTKKEANKIFEQLGITMTDAINLFLRQVIDKRGLPFPVSLKHEPCHEPCDDDDE
jgi:DNA-damage-inducible protein J